MKQVLNTEADAYVLAAAVANLMPSSPYVGKFPSHNYKVGDKFPIEFEIAPRVIDDIKEKHPRSTLIGYKLFDGSDEEIIRAATITLHESKANLVFANHPAWAKTRKIAVTQDGSVFDRSFDEHVELINRLVHQTFYSTTIDNTRKVLGDLTDYDLTVTRTYPKYPKDGRVYGTFAIRKDGYFLTSTRGKTETGPWRSITAVFNVDHEKRVITAHDRATLNAPLLDALLKRNPHINILIHGHELIGDIVHDAYEFPGTDGDLRFTHCLETKRPILLNHHGYIVGFETLEQYQDWIKSR